MFFKKNDVENLQECGYLKNDNSRICLVFKIIILEQNEEYLYFTTNGEESINERSLNK